MTTITDPADAAPDQRVPAAFARSAPTAYASVYVPQGRRRWYWMTFRCPECGTYIFARARHLDEVAAPRRVTCGHRVRVAAARILGRADSEAA